MKRFFNVIPLNLQPLYNIVSGFPFSAHRNEQLGMDKIDTKSVIFIQLSS